ncbi:MAG: DUF11 domain-containing protein, partial [Acidimicrobiia bacterium]|nr:DUF11 domain-containing protein [Acidimicrobiia bacterium]
IDSGSFANTASTSGDCPDGTVDDDCATASDTETVALTADPAIEIDKRALDGTDSQVVTTGELAEFTISVTNTGNVTLTDVVVTDVLASSCEAAAIRDLIPGDSETYDCTQTVTAAFTNVAVVTALGPQSQSVTDEDSSDVTILANVCEFGKPDALILTYTGLGPDGTNNSQSGNEVILDGDANDQDPVWMVVRDHKGVVIFEGAVAIGESFTVEGTKNKIPPRMLFEMYDTQGGTKLETVRFHTSCSQPLFAGDQFGSITVAGEVIDDKVRPKVKVDKPSDGAKNVVGPKVTVSGTASDGGGIDRVRVYIKNRDTGQSWNGTEWVDAWSWVLAEGTTSWSYEIELEEGSYQVLAWSWDRSGDMSAYAQSLFIVGDRPIAIIEEPVDGSTIAPGELKITGSASDVDGIDRVRLFIRNRDNLKSWNGSEWVDSWTWILLEGREDWEYTVDLDAGRYQILVWTWDTNNNRSDYAQSLFEVAGT